MAGTGSLASASLGVAPRPPVVGGLPFVGCGPRFIRNPKGFLLEMKAKHGDVFLARIFGWRLLFVFSAPALKSLYELPEEQASFTEATRTLIGLKLPAELLEGDMEMFRHLFTRERMPSLLAHVDEAVREEIERLGSAGEIEVFGAMKTVVHKLAFRAWAGREAASPPYLERLIRDFETLDPEQSFVNPASLLKTIATRKAPERRALRDVEAALSEIWLARERAGIRAGDMLEALHAGYGDLPPQMRHARAAKDVMILHLASQTNLYASIAWSLIHLLLRPDLRAGVEARNVELAVLHGSGRYLAEPGALGEMDLAERCIRESIRMAQQSLTLRKVLRPCVVESDGVTYEVQPGVFVATLLSVNNTAFGTLERFDPGHWERGRIAGSVGLPAQELVSTFGHGRHSCVGERFAIAATKIVLARLLERFDFEPRFSSVAIAETQMGAVGRAAHPCIVAYRARGAARVA